MQIKGLDFNTPAQPYKAGHVLKENEAAALNQTWLENIRNNIAKTVEEEIDKAKAENRAPNMKALQKLVDEKAADYTFGAGRQSDPIETAARRLARDVVFKNLRKKGVKVKDVPTVEIDRLIDTVLKDHPKVREVAKRQVAEAAQLKAALV